MANPRAGKILQGRYRLRSILAEGGMGVVWQAERVGIERPVVVKFLQSVLSERPGAVDRFEREARATARLNHPNCVQLVDFGLDEGQPYLVVEFVEGQTLAELLDHGPLDGRRATRISIQVLAGLEHAHERGILHRDLKPANLMIVEAVGYEDFVKILDFGLAKIVGEVDRREVTVHGVALGTPGYMSPEQAAGMPSDLRADVYSTGAVLYHLLTGVKVFEGGNVHSILRKHREDTPAPPRSLRGPGSISAELDAVVTRAMQRDPERRYPTASEMRRALEATPEGMSGEGVGARTTAPRRVAAPVDRRLDASAPTRVPRRTAVVRPPQHRSPRWPGVVGLSLTMAALGAGGSLLYIQTRRTDPVATALPSTGTDPGVVAAPIVSAVLADAASGPQVTVAALRPAAPSPHSDGGTGPTVTPIAAAPGAVQVGIAPSAAEPEPAPDEADDGSAEDARIPPSPPAEAPRREARDVHSIADVRVLVRRGETDHARSGLYQLRRRPGLTPQRQAEIATLLGHLYVDRRWVADGLREYRYALSLDLRARGDATIINNTVRALAEPATRARARRVLIDFVGRAAIPALRHVAERPESRAVAEEVLAKLGAAHR